MAEYHQRATESLLRAKTLAKRYKLSEKDVAELSPAFWKMHTEPIMGLDAAATTLLTIQLNLVGGTLATHTPARPSLRPLLKQVLDFDVTAQFCLTELDHGLDAFNLETTVTVLPDGWLELHTPHPGASKYMPPTAPAGLPCVALVFARLMVGGEFRGIRPVIVPVSDGVRTSPGITVRILPPRGLSYPVLHSITSFNRVKLPPIALLGSLEASQWPRLDFLQAIWRVAVGSISLACLVAPAMQMSAVVAGRYSIRRTVAGRQGERVPVITFKTQFAPILSCLATSFVLREFGKVATRLFSDASLDPRVRHAIAAVFKVTAVPEGQRYHLMLSERLGARGLFKHNQIYLLHAEFRGIAIAEGDLLGISIRKFISLASELLLDRYELPSSINPNSLLARHEEGIFREARQSLQEIANHRSDAFNRKILPLSEKILQSIGFRMAYDAAIEAGLDSRIVNLFQYSTVRQDEAWYTEVLGMSRQTQFNLEDEALQNAYPLLEKWMDEAGVDHAITSPIVSQERWDAFVSQLEVAPSMGEEEPVEIISHL